MKNWTIDADGIAATATTTSARVDLTADGRNGVANDVMVDNRGTVDVYVRAGGSTVVATTASMRVPAGSMQPFAKGSATHLALLAASSTAAVVVYVGDGQ